MSARSFTSTYLILIGAALTQIPLCILAGMTRARPFAFASHVRPGHAHPLRRQAYRIRKPTSDLNSYNASSHTLRYSELALEDPRSENTSFPTPVRCTLQIKMQTHTASSSLNFRVASSAAVSVSAAVCTSHCARTRHSSDSWIRVQSTATAFETVILLIYGRLKRSAIRDTLSTGRWTTSKDANPNFDPRSCA